MTGQRELSIASAQGAYRVSFAPAITDIVATIDRLGDPFIVIDARVAERYADELAPLAHRPILRLTATEAAKTFAGVEAVCAFLQDGSASKKSTLVAIGGGIVQDITTFASHIYFRGIDYVYVPTTLLSMADSCIGAKCALNFGSAKNQIGFFHAPKAVFITTAFLATLADADIRSGLGEIVKLALIGSADDYAFVARELREIGIRGAALSELILRSLQIKRRFIERDEYDTGPRKLLNYGHTFGHALESLTEHAVPHGIAVAWGCDLANYLAVSYGFLERDLFDDIHRTLLLLVDLPSTPTYDAQALVNQIKRDKKASAGSVGLILLRHPGEIAIEHKPIDQHLTSLVDTYVRTADLLREAKLSFGRA
jgi:3-dehydroquinate synthase